MSNNESDRSPINVGRVLQAIERKFGALYDGRIVSCELGLLKVGANAAFHAEVIPTEGFLVEIRTDVFGNFAQIETEVSLHTLEDNVQFFIRRDKIKSLQSIPELIETARGIQLEMATGKSYEEAIEQYRQV